MSNQIKIITLASSLESHTLHDVIPRYYLVKYIDKNKHNITY